MFESISLAAVMIFIHVGRIKVTFIPNLLQCKGAGPCLGELLSLQPKHPHPKLWGKSPLHAGNSPFNGKDLLVLLLESSAPPTWGEVQTLPGEQAQGTHLEWHHLDRGNLSIQPQDVLKESNIQGPQGSNHCCLHSATPPARGQQRIWVLQPEELLQSPGRSRAAAPLLSLNCHTLVPFPGKQTFLH